MTTPTTPRPLPKAARYIAPLIRAIRELGGSARPDEATAVIARDLHISEAEQSEPLPSGGQTRFENQIQWARFYLAKAGYIDKSQRGVWTLTEKGRNLGELTNEDVAMIVANAKAEMPTPEAAVEPQDSEPDAPVVAGTGGQLIRILQSLSPNGFERFCQRILRELDFQEVKVTGRSGDEGIDGIGTLQVHPLVGFKVLFQCKRYVGSVTPSQVRDFRGTMAGRADKGIIITTGSFTANARKEAIREGASSIELVDGEKLVELLEKNKLGLNPNQPGEIDLAFFEEFRK